MTKKAAIGHVNCIFCGFDAEVKTSDKSGLAYVYCPDCNAQSFCRTKAQNDALLSKMRPVTVTEIKPPIAADLPPVKESMLHPVKENKAGFSLGNL